MNVSIKRDIRFRRDNIVSRRTDKPVHTNARIMNTRLKARMQASPRNQGEKEENGETF